LFGAIQAEVVLACPDAAAPTQLLLTVRIIAARNLIDREDSSAPAPNVYVVSETHAYTHAHAQIHTYTQRHTHTVLRAHTQPVFV
jgi:hypothetical protein